MINALIAQIEAVSGQRVPRYLIAKKLTIRPSTLSKWTLGRTKLEQIEGLLDLLALVGENERWQREVCAALEKPPKAQPKERRQVTKARRSR